MITKTDLRSNLTQQGGNDVDLSMPLNLENQISQVNLILLAKSLINYPHFAKKSKTAGHGLIPTANPIFES